MAHPNSMINGTGAEAGAVPNGEIPRELENHGNPIRNLYSCECEYFDSFDAFMHELQMRPVEMPKQKTDFVKGLFHPEYFQEEDKKPYSFREMDQNSVTIILSLGAGARPSIPNIFRHFLSRRVRQKIIIIAFDMEFNTGTCSDFKRLLRGYFESIMEHPEPNNVRGGFMAEASAASAAAASGGGGGGSGYSTATVAGGAEGGSAAAVHRVADVTGRAEPLLDIKACFIKTKIPKSNNITEIKLLYSFQTKPDMTFEYFKDKNNCSLEENANNDQWRTLFKSLVSDIKRINKPIYIHHDAWWNVNSPGGRFPGSRITRIFRYGLNFEELCIIPTVLLAFIESNLVFIIRGGDGSFVIHNIASPDAVYKYGNRELYANNAHELGLDDPSRGNSGIVSVLKRNWMAYLPPRPGGGRGGAYTCHRKSRRKVRNSRRKTRQRFNK